MPVFYHRPIFISHITGTGITNLFFSFSTKFAFAVEWTRGFSHFAFVLSGGSQAGRQILIIICILWGHLRTWRVTTQWHENAKYVDVKTKGFVRTFWRFWVHRIIEKGSTVIEELKLVHGRFRVYFRLSVGQFKACLQILAPHLRRQSSNHLTSPTDGWYFGLHC